MNRKPLSDAQWSLIEPFLARDCSKGGRPPKDSRQMVDAILLVLRSGIPWRDLDRDYGPWGSVYTRFRRWSLSGVWQQMLTALRACSKPRYFDRHIYQERHLVECFFNRIKQFRRVAMRYEKTARHYLAMVLIACILVWMV